jgi:RNA polymerase sigma-70 factor (ECF subfamily)
VDETVLATARSEQLGAGGAVKPDATLLVEDAYIRYAPDVFRYALVLTKSTHEAEDITAETFARALRAWRTGGPPKSHLAWLLVGARRLAIDRWRRARRRLVAGQYAADRATTGGELDRVGARVWFECFARALTTRQRDVLLLRYEHGLSDAEIAEILGISRSGVRSLCARALDVIREHPELYT